MRETSIRQTSCNKYTLIYQLIKVSTFNWKRKFLEKISLWKQFLQCLENKTVFL